MMRLIQTEGLSHAHKGAKTNVNLLSPKHLVTVSIYDAQNNTFELLTLGLHTLYEFSTRDGDSYEKPAGFNCAAASSSGVC